MAAKVQKTENSYSSSCHVSDLPSSLIYEILVKLPIKSVIRCRCVCKNWYDLISAKYFTTLYSKNPPFTVLVKLKRNTIEDGLLNQSSCFLEIGLDGVIMCTPFNPRVMNFERNDGFLETVGSCNGLLCFVQRQFHKLHEMTDNINFNYDEVYVINPLLGEVMMLPQVNQYENIKFVFCGFGFGIPSDLYKVVRFVRVAVGEIYGEIFTIGVDKKWRSFEDSSIPFCIYPVDCKWRYFEHSSIPYYIYPCSISLNGFLYFVGDVGLFAFDIEEERGRIIVLPSEFEYKPKNIFLGVSNGNLCLTDNSIEDKVAIWTRKLNGAGESWYREIIVYRWISVDLSCHDLTVVTALRNGDLIMSCYNFVSDLSKILISYDPKTKKCCDVELGDSYFYGYVPSFFPLNAIL